jgi:hypothetical protein
MLKNTDVNSFKEKSALFENTQNEKSFFDEHFNK